MAGIMDAWRHFVGQQAATVFEEFDGQDTDVLEGLEHATRSVFGGALERGIETRRWRERKAQDAVAVMIFHQWIKGGFPGPAAHGEYAQLAREGDETLQDERSVVSVARGTRFFRGQFVLCARDIFVCAQNPLAFTVIAHAAGL